MQQIMIYAAAVRHAGRENIGPTVRRFNTLVREAPLFSVYVLSLRRLGSL